MKAIRRLLDRLHATFAKGGKYERLYPLYEATDTFLYTPGEVTKRASHVRDSMDLKRMMITVVVALGPCIAMAMWNTGHQANLAMAAHNVESLGGWRGAFVTLFGAGGLNPDSVWDCLVHGAAYFLPVYLVTMMVGGAWEVLFSCVRGHDLTEGFLVTGMLFPLTLPPTIPLWQVALGISFGVVIGKEIFGGVGKNFLNPALTGRAFLYFAYPAAMVGDAVWTAVDIDGFSGATPLTHLGSAQSGSGMEVIEGAIAGGGLDISWSDAFLGTIPGSMGETSTLACLIGAAILIITGIGSWRIMAAVLIGAFCTAAAFYAFHNRVDVPMYAMPPWWHLVTGGFAFGLVFMATDPVSAAMTQTGQWFYGALIGVMTILIRVINPAFPEGIMLAILFGNVFAPLIDWCVLQRNIRRRAARSEQ
ncbi:MAG: NADH:ubiquinone reductase (Na(+)-transporting) subunit B [Planctomycetaceae bacterium]